MVQSHLWTCTECHDRAHYRGNLHTAQKQGFIFNQKSLAMGARFMLLLSMSREETNPFNVLGLCPVSKCLSAPSFLREAKPHPGNFASILAEFKGFLILLRVKKSMPGGGGSGGTCL